ncbi:MAG: cupredoxin domain-containing protein [Deltaproteobacteria bacterium]|nr:cupredoxin domain-containing protein [Deltaproteobacteria bacterium]
MRYLLNGLVLSLVCISSASYSAGEIKPYIAAIAGDGVQRVTILADSYYFNPDHIIVKVNAPVELTVTKESGITPHNFVIKGTDADIEISESLSTTPKSIRFTPKRVGEYQFYCDKRLLFFKSHGEKGMKGILEVTE